MSEGWPLREPELQRMVSQRLVGAGWRVEPEKVVGLYRPDLLAWSPANRLFAIELKAKEGTVHFATINNVAALRSGLAAFGDLQAQPVLLAVGRVTPSLRELARRIQVLLIVEPPSDPETTARALATTLLRASDAPEPWTAV